MEWSTTAQTAIDGHHHHIFFNKMPTKRSKYIMAEISVNKLEQ